MLTRAADRPNTKSGRAQASWLACRTPRDALPNKRLTQGLRGPSSLGSVSALEVFGNVDALVIKWEPNRKLIVPSLVSCWRGIARNWCTHFLPIHIVKYDPHN